VRVEEGSLLTLCQSVLDGTASYSTGQFLDKLVSEAGKNNTIYKDLKSRLPRQGSQQAAYHYWVYTLTEKDTKGCSLRGVIKTADCAIISGCIGTRGGRGTKDNNFKNIEVGKGNGREWKSNKGKFWIEKLKAMSNEWYKKKGITVAPPGDETARKGYCPEAFSTLTAKPLDDLDLADLESEEENENGNE